MAGKTYMTEDWRPTVSCIVKLKAKYPRHDIEHYIEEMRDSYLANGKPMKSWDATFRNWIRRAPNFGAIVNLKLWPEQKPQADVHDMVTIRIAKSKGIGTSGKTEEQLNQAIWEHDMIRLRDGD